MSENSYYKQSLKPLCNYQVGVIHLATVADRSYKNKIKLKSALLVH